MIRCDVLIVGGGPAGSTCAWRLRHAGLDVLVMDAATFPRDKVCAGWMTPQVLQELQLDVEEYRRGRTLQIISGFRTGVIGRRHHTTTSYARPVSVAVRRCEFDHYLLIRSGARLMLGTAATSIRRDGEDWVINGDVRAPMLVGAGGHFCPVARWLNASNFAVDGAPLVVAQETEFAIDPADRAGLPIAGGVPELFFCRDLRGYGWCIRKGDYLNIGLGRVGRQSLRRAVAEFRSFLLGRGKVTPRMPTRWAGHVYLLRDARHRRVVENGVMLIGDAAGLAFPQSGEGIRPAVESGLLAAGTVIDAGGRYTRDRLEPYAARLYGASRAGPQPSWRARPSPFAAAIGRSLLRVPPFVRHVVLDRWFLHAGEPPLAEPPIRNVRTEEEMSWPSTR